MANRRDNSREPVVAVNRRARHDYFIEQTLEAGLALQGWEVKALRAGRASITQGYVTIKGGEAILLGAQINPLPQACAFVAADAERTRKLLLHRREIDRLTGQVQRQGYTLIPLKLYWKGARAKLEVGVARGKQEHDKRDAIREREWQSDRARIFKKNLRQS